MQAWTHVGQLDEVLKVFDRRITPALVEITDKWRPVCWYQYRSVAADHDAALGITGMLLVFRGRARLDDRATHASWEAHALAIDISACVLQEFECSWKIAKLYADFLKQYLGIVLDKLQALFVEDLKVRDLAIDPRLCRCLRREAGSALGGPATLASSTSAQYRTQSVRIVLVTLPSPGILSSPTVCSRTQNAA